MTHAELVVRAERWLWNHVRCVVVLAEPGGCSEIPDAIGWQGGDMPQSHLVECKATRADFLRDRKKLFRIEGGIGIGRFRYYMALPGVIRPDELPPRWGLLEVRPKTVRRLVKAKRWDLDRSGYLLSMAHELSLMLCELRKVQAIMAGEGACLMQSKRVRLLREMLPTASSGVSNAQPA